MVIDQFFLDVTPSHWVIVFRRSGLIVRGRNPQRLGHCSWRFRPRRWDHCIPRNANNQLRSYMYSRRTDTSATPPCDNLRISHAQLRRSFSRRWFAGEIFYNEVDLRLRGEDPFVPLMWSSPIQPAEIVAINYCSDRAECRAYRQLLSCVKNNR